MQALYWILIIGSLVAVASGIQFLCNYHRHYSFSEAAAFALCQPLRQLNDQRAPKGHGGYFPKGIEKKYTVGNQKVLILYGYGRTEEGLVEGLALQVHGTPSRFFFRLKDNVVQDMGRAGGTSMPFILNEYTKSNLESILRRVKEAARA